MQENLLRKKMHEKTQSFSKRRLAMYHRQETYKKHSKSFIEDLTPNTEKMLFILFHLAIESAFYGSAIFSYDTPITALAFIANCINNRQNPFKDISKTKVWGLIFGACLVLFGGVSLLRATSFIPTFKRLFKLSFVILLFFIVILYIDNHKKFKSLVYNLTANTSLILLLGVYETFGNNYIFIDK